MRLMLSTLACFSLLLLVLFMFKTSFPKDGSAKFQSFATGSMSKHSQAKRGSRHQHKDEENGRGEVGGVLGDEKRKVYTGPNPLHNR
ncbi:hypothetical protein HN51_023958 [Arachis hypogaea]